MSMARCLRPSSSSRAPASGLAIVPAVVILRSPSGSSSDTGEVSRGPPSVGSGSAGRFARASWVVFLTSGTSCVRRHARGSPLLRCGSEGSENMGVMATAMSREFSSERLALTGAARAEAKAQNSSSWTPAAAPTAATTSPGRKFPALNGVAPLARLGITSRLSEVTPAARAAATARATTRSGPSCLPGSRARDVSAPKNPLKPQNPKTPKPPSKYLIKLLD